MSADPRKEKQVPDLEMHPVIGHGRRKKNPGRNHARDPKENLDIDPEIGLDLTNGHRTVEEGHDPGSTMKADGSIASPEVEMKTKTTLTMTEGQGNGIPASTTKDQP